MKKILYKLSSVIFYYYFKTMILFGRKIGTLDIFHDLVKNGYSFIIRWPYSLIFVENYPNIGKTIFSSEKQYAFNF